MSLNTPSPIRKKENPVDIQECHEYITKLELRNKRRGRPGKRDEKLLKDIKECLVWVELNG